jgi:hypothetical protein
MRGLTKAAGAIAASAALLAITGVAGAAAASPAAIAYEVSGRSEQVWAVDAGGTGRVHLGPGEQPLVSPNGQMVAASRFGSSGRALIVYSTVGKPTQEYVNLAQTAATALAWSPDSRYLAVQLTDTTASSTATDPGAGGVAILDTATDTITRVARGFVFGASFDPVAGATERLAYGLSHAQTLTAPTAIDTINADGTGRTQITHDGRSLAPVWGPHGIAYDRERFRGQNAPVYNIWLMDADGSHRTQITHVPVGPLVDGLIPLAFSATGRRMIAEFVGEDTSEGYTVSVTAHTAAPIRIAHHSSVNADGISADGRTLLVTLDAFENPTAEGKVATAPFAGGQPTILARHAGFATWNG